MHKCFLLLCILRLKRTQEREIFKIMIWKKTYTTIMLFCLACLLVSCKKIYKSPNRRPSDSLIETETVISTQDFQNAVNGDIIIFGKYEQDADTTNGAEGIEWIVLDKQPDAMLILSKYVLDCSLYNETYIETLTWEVCDLRNWLNEFFFENAFSKNEQKLISLSSLSNSANPRTKIDGGNETQDHIFLLSINEVFSYYEYDYEACMTSPTKYAFQQGCTCYGVKPDNLRRYVYQDGDEYPEDGVSCFWWLRTPGRLPSKVAMIDGIGGINYNGIFPNTEALGVRPALWLKLN